MRGQLSEEADGARSFLYGTVPDITTSQGRDRVDRIARPPGATRTDVGARSHARHRPELTLLHRLVEEHHRSLRRAARRRRQVPGAPCRARVRGLPRLRTARARLPARRLRRVPGRAPRRLQLQATRLSARAAARLDLEPLRARVKSVEGRAGHPAIDPAILVTLWLHATIDAVGPARKLDRPCDTGAVYRWLCGGVSVDYHTLAHFRTAHGDWLDAALTRSIASLVEHQLVTLRAIAQDGMRVRASAKAASFRRRPKLEQLLGEARARVAMLRQELSGDGLVQHQKAAQKRAAAEQEQRLSDALAMMERIETERAPKRKLDASEDPDDPNDPPSSRAPDVDGGADPAPGAGEPQARRRSSRARDRGHRRGGHVAHVHGERDAPSALQVARRHGGVRARARAPPGPDPVPGPGPGQGALRSVVACAGARRDRSAATGVVEDRSTARASAR